MTAETAQRLAEGRRRAHAARVDQAVRRVAALRDWTRSRCQGAPPPIPSDHEFQLAREATQR